MYGKNFQPKDVPIKDATAIMFAFAEVGNCARPYATDANPGLCNASGQYGTATGIQDYKLYSADAYSDFYTIPKGYKHAGEPGLGTASKIINLAHDQHKPVILSIGGWTLSVALGTAMSPFLQDQFIQSVIDYLNLEKADNKGQSFDGVDIDWEPHGNQWVNVSDAELEGWVSFLTKLKKALVTHYDKNAWLTIAAPASPIGIRRIGADNWKQLSDALDYINVMSYDYHGGFDNPAITNFNAPLHYDAKQPMDVSFREDFNVESTYKAFDEMGVPANKLIVGFPAYGRAVKNVANVSPDGQGKTPGLYQPFDGMPSGEWDPAGDPASGMFDYKYIVQHLLKEGYQSYQVPEAGEVAAYNPGLGVWLSYDDQDLVKQKAAFTLAHHYGGMMMWEASTDFGQNDPGYATKSLVHTAKTALSGS